MYLELNCIINEIAHWNHCHSQEKHSLCDQNCGNGLQVSCVYYYRLPLADIAAAALT